VRNSFNEHQIQRVHQFVYSSKDIFAEVRRICQAQPELTSPPSHELAIEKLDDNSSFIVSIQVAAGATIHASDLAPDLVAIS
jgi:hypothetical protein